MIDQAYCKGSYLLGTACGKCGRCIENKKDILWKLLPRQNPNDAFDIFVSTKPSYYTDEHRQSFLAGWKKSRGE